MNWCRSVAAACVASAIATVAVTAAAIVAGAIRVTPIVNDGQVSASFAAPAAFDDDTRAIIDSGLLLTFTFVVDLRRASSVWLDETLASSEVSASVKFDNLTGTYQVTRVIAGHVVSAERTRDDVEVRAAMTTFERVSLVPDRALEPNTDYYVRVRLRMSPRRTFSLWPFGGDDGVGRAGFTFIR